MRCFIFLALFFVTSFASAAGWVPPKDPKPAKILSEANQDRDSKNYEDALAKYVWIHENAVAIQPDFVAVRLSFALSAWGKLAEKYPPALKKLEEFRDKATASVKEGKAVTESFRELASINRVLDQESKTKELFVDLDNKNPNVAKKHSSLLSLRCSKQRSISYMQNILNQKMICPIS